MNITWTDVLTYSGLKDAKVVAGINGLNRQIRFISVYDCVQLDDFNPDESGVLYITTFGQFKESPDRILPWVKYLNEQKVSGLCTISDAAEELSQEVINYCNDNAFPIISVDTNLPYAEIIDNVSSLLHFNNLHIVNEKRIEKIIYNKLSEEEIMEEVRGINLNFKDRIVILAVAGSFESHIYMKRMNSLFREHRENAYVQFQEKHFFILSNEADAGLDKKAASTLSLIKPLFVNPQIGVSKKYDLADLGKAISNAQRALYIAQISSNDYVAYDDFSDLALLYPFRDSEEVRAFYRKFKSLLEADDASGKMQFAECIRGYVRTKGNWAEVARLLFQSESTIRYRLNRVKAVLGLENDTIKFHELISIFTTIDEIYNSK